MKELKIMWLLGSNYKKKKKEFLRKSKKCNRNLKSSKKNNQVISFNFLLKKERKLNKCNNFWKFKNQVKFFLRNLAKKLNKRKIWTSLLQWNLKDAALPSITINNLPVLVIHQTQAPQVSTELKTRNIKEE